MHEPSYSFSVNYFVTFASLHEHKRIHHHHAPTTQIPGFVPNHVCLCLYRETSKGGTPYYLCAATWGHTAYRSMKVSTLWYNDLPIWTEHQIYLDCADGRACCLEGSKGSFNYLHILWYHCYIEVESKFMFITIACLANEIVRIQIIIRSMRNDSQAIRHQQCHLDLMGCFWNLFAACYFVEAWKVFSHTRCISGHKACMQHLYSQTANTCMGRPTINKHPDNQTRGSCNKPDSIQNHHNKSILLNHTIE